MSDNDGPFQEPFPRTDEEFQQWFANVHALLALREGRAEGKDDERFRGGRLSCQRWRFGLHLCPDLCDRLKLSYFWFADGHVYDPIEIERYTKGIIKWEWNENWEREACLNRSMCYDRRERP